ncbi:hypothetical protein ACFL9U_15485 [Thermodesulfobacteriota bacterium]
MANIGKIKFYPILFILLLCPMGFSANAGTLAITPKTTIEVQGNRLSGTIEVCNNGDETAYYVQAEIEVLGDLIETSIKEGIKPNNCEKFHFLKEFDFIGKGIFPVIIKIHYHDFNRYPFSALAYAFFGSETDAQTDILYRSENAVIEGKGRLSVYVKNLGSELKQIRASLILPREIFSPESRFMFKLGTQEEKTLRFVMENKSAQSGATYPVYCLLEYDRRGIHHTVVSKAILKVKERENFLRQIRWNLLFGGFFALTIFFACRVLCNKQKLFSKPSS